ncbi:MAG: helix-turn-helix domain-containing protein [Candidatus Eisenbacteria bacterium]|uniref:Helix-turn-helix domain-containing protein n=1 Tax=Eiseniibacteriota bacterium TaxID=2212470 RepID=A0A948RVN8_UNCEI|nr:helix-turn-helix domain-containing protein [Candidatus Eisenbacteria bacterium]MBU1948146.1 helix-turn-helix domain-containing protein [Candidatus Eisenbacteria bacterium]MBU2691880.1 helix-turn-helix domain-containing protein [Candidatus Eisenbacteria bacterium]
MSAGMYLTPEEVVERFRGRVSMKTLTNWRAEGKGPTWIRVGGRILYPSRSFVEWEKSRGSGNIKEMGIKTGDQIAG